MKFFFEIVAYHQHCCELWWKKKKIFLCKKNAAVPLVILHVYRIHIVRCYKRCTWIHCTHTQSMVSFICHISHLIALCLSLSLIIDTVLNHTYRIFIFINLSPVCHDKFSLHTTIPIDKIKSKKKLLT